MFDLGSSWNYISTQDMIIYFFKIYVGSSNNWNYIGKVRLSKKRKRKRNGWLVFQKWMSKSTICIQCIPPPTHTCNEKICIITSVFNDFPVSWVCNQHLEVSWVCFQLHIVWTKKNPSLSILLVEPLHSFPLQLIKKYFRIVIISYHWSYLLYRCILMHSTFFFENVS